MSPANAPISGTREASTLLVISTEVGTLDAGKFADSVAVRGNPLNNISSTETPVFVMKRGQVVVQRKLEPLVS